MVIVLGASCICLSLILLVLAWLYGFGDALIFEYGLQRQIGRLLKQGIRLSTQEKNRGDVHPGCT